MIRLLREHARASIASLSGPLAEELVRDQVRQVREARQRQKSLEKMLVDAYQQLPDDNHLASIPGIGEVTAAILTARIVRIDRFDTPGQLVGYLGTFPVEASSGLDRDGKRRAPKRYVMCPRGCDLCRRYLWTAALSAGQHNPAVRPLYQRVRARHPDHPAIAVGHAMRKLLHLVFAVWHTGQPFDPEHHPWESPAHVAMKNATKAPLVDTPADAADKELAAGHNPEAEPEKPVVTAACPASIAEPPLPVESPTPATTDNDSSQSPGANPWINFAHVRAQLPLERMLAHLGLLDKLQGRSRSRRGPCPLHDGGSRGKTFSVHLDNNVFQCFDPKCGIKGDVIDLWAAVKQLPLREAALDLVRTFNLEPAPP
jgi:hypothetical protein